VRRIADEEAAAGHDVTALELYFEAASEFGRAQHVIFRTDDEKRYLHGASLECYAEVRARSPYPIEPISVELDGQQFTGNLHVHPDGRRAPLVFYITGCDLTKEMYPHPLANHTHQRGMHIVSFDGPGQGESNLRGNALTVDNYERAASALLDVLLARDDIDGDRVGVYGQGFGSYWAARFAAHDHRIAAHVGLGSTLCDPRYLFERDSPRYKQLFAYLTQASDEAALDAFVAAMPVGPLLPAITCPSLVVTGEYDPRNDLGELADLVASTSGPSELWVLADQHHLVSYPPGREGPLWDNPSHRLALDWLRDALGPAAEVSARPEFLVRYIDSAAGGPYGPAVGSSVRWFDR
jgi:pimeloyl-ACP methyl ester carboxylesterase